MKAVPLIGIGQLVDMGLYCQLVYEQCGHTLDLPRFANAEHWVRRHLAACRECQRRISAPRKYKTKRGTVVALTPDELALVITWFETAALPAPPFHSAPWAEIHEPEQWRADILRDLLAGPSDLDREAVLLEVRWLAKRIAPPDVQAAAHTDELVHRQGPAFLSEIHT